MREGVNKVALCLFEHNEKVYHAAVRMMDQYGKAAIVHPTGTGKSYIIFSKYASTGDGILTSLKMMEVMLAKKVPMSKLAEPLKIYPQVLENVRVTDKKAAQNDPAVQEAVKAVAEALGDTGRILVRESGTEPVVRVMVEAPDHDTCQKYVSQVVEVIKAKGYAV